jgi:N-acyl-D-aspartate/D-glutamate deacylase
MARERGKQNRTASDGDAQHAPDRQDGTKEDQPALADLARRALTLGLSGLFFTESTIRKALGDTLPKEWSDFAVNQSERTRKEFLERLTFELAQSLEKVDLASVMAELMRGRTLDISARIRLVDGQTDEAPEHTLHVRLQGDDGGDT